MSTPLKPHVLYSITDLVGRLGLSREVFQSAIHRGQLRITRQGGRVLISGADIYEWLNLPIPVAAIIETGREYPEIPEDMSEIAPYRLYTVPYIEHALAPAISARTLYREINVGRLKAVRVGERRVYLQGIDVLKWLGLV